MDSLDCRLVNLLQDGIDIEERPFRTVAVSLGISETEVVERIGHLVGSGYLSRFGPMYDAEKLGGALSLCAMQVPEKRFEEVAAAVNAFDEVAHNYRREHSFNMWFVLATETPQAISETVQAIERR